MAENHDEGQGVSSDRAKETDGRVSLPQCARIADVAPRTLANWISSGFITPTNTDHTAPGRGNHRRFDLRDLTAICAAAHLREQGVTVRDMRRIQAVLREYDRDLATAQLAVIQNSESGAADVVMLQGTRERKNLIVSVHDSPGQTILADIPLAPIARAARKGFSKALAEPAAIRGKRGPRKRAKRAGPNENGGEALAG